jgi:DNA-binding transcriptional ArsR family regulator
MSTANAALIRQVRTAAPVFAALGDQTRLRIVGRLAGGESLSIATLTAGTGVTRQAVTKHLSVLDEAGLVRSEWRGRERMWALNAERIDAARRSLDVIAAQWDQGLARLKAFVENDSRQE